MGHSPYFRQQFSHSLPFVLCVLCHSLHLRTKKFRWRLRSTIYFDDSTSLYTNLIYFKFFASRIDLRNENFVRKFLCWFSNGCCFGWQLVDTPDQFSIFQRMRSIHSIICLETHTRWMCVFVCVCRAEKMGHSTGFWTTNKSHSFAIQAISFGHLFETQIYTELSNITVKFMFVF